MKIDLRPFKTCVSILWVSITDVVLVSDPTRLFMSKSDKESFFIFVSMQRVTNRKAEKYKP